MFALTLLFVALIVLIINVIMCPTMQERDYSCHIDEETKRQVVNSVLQAYLDGVEYGLSMSKASENLPLEIDNNDKKEKNEE